MQTKNQNQNPFSQDNLISQARYILENYTESDIKTVFEVTTPEEKQAIISKIWKFLPAWKAEFIKKFILAESLFIESI